MPAIKVLSKKYILIILKYLYLGEFKSTKNYYNAGFPQEFRLVGGLLLKKPEHSY